MDDATLMLIVIPVCGIVVGLLAVGGFLVLRDTIRGRGRWGVNGKPVYCPECGAQAPVVRQPKNRRQMLWGGCTCEECGTEYDKWGHRLEDEDNENREPDRRHKKG